MKNKKRIHQEWPAELQKAVDEYPRIVASPDFNQRVLQALAEKQAQQNKIDLFCDALDRIFERPLLKLLGTALFAIMLAWGGSNLLLQCSGAAMPNANESTIPFNIDAQSLDSLPPHLTNLYASQMGFQLQYPPLNNSQPTTKVLSPGRKETSCSPNETILWG
jgi:hypothetical protein